MAEIIHRLDPRKDATCYCGVSPTAEGVRTEGVNASQKRTNCEACLLAEAKHTGKCQGKARQFLGECLNRPKIIRDGKPYCWMHDPDRVARIASENWEKRKLEIKAIEDSHDARIKRRVLEQATGIDKLTDDDLRNIIDLGGIRRMIDNQLQGRETA